MNRIKELREERNLKQTDVALATGIDQRSLSNYETGKTNPDSYVIERLVKFFNVTSDYLLGFSDRDFQSNEDILADIDEIKKKLDDIKNWLNSN